MGANLTGTNFADASFEGTRIPKGFLVPGTRVDAVSWKGTPYGWQIVASPRGLRFFPLSEA